MGPKRFGGFTILAGVVGMLFVSSFALAEARLETKSATSVVVCSGGRSLSGAAGNLTKAINAARVEVETETAKDNTATQYVLSGPLNASAPSVVTYGFGRSQTWWVCVTVHSAPTRKAQ
jgi:hypothetical protein